MDFKWSAQFDNGLRELDGERLYETYHVASRVVPDVSRLAPAITANAFELFVASRGFRQHRALPGVQLSELQASNEELQTVMLRRRTSRELSARLSFAEASTVLRQALGITTLVENAAFGITQGLRSWPSAGGLYPLDAYLVAARVSELEGGLYHFNVPQERLERLPGRAPRDVLAEGFLWQDFITSAAAVVLLVGVFERTVIKYGERGYRLVLLDAGHAAQNLLLACEQCGLPAAAIGGFADEALARDLRIDGVSRAVVHAVAIGGRLSEGGPVEHRDSEGETIAE
jgi:SagB-type dehydrogenase family enzyme